MPFRALLPLLFLLIAPIILGAPGPGISEQKILPPRPAIPIPLDEQLDFVSVRKGAAVDLVVRDQEWLLLATRLDHHGRALDPDGIVIAERALSSAAIASDRRDFLVVWSEGTAIRGSRLTAEGELLDPTGFFIAELPWSPERPAVVYAAGAYLVVFTRIHGLNESRADQGVWGQWVLPSGTLLNQPFLIAADPDWQFHAFQRPVSDVSASWNGSVVLVAWIQRLRESGPGCALNGCAATSTRAVRLRGFDVLDPVPIEVSTGRGDSDAEVDTDGNDFLVAWTGRVRREWPAIVAAKIDGDGTPHPEQWIGEGHAPSLAWDGSRYQIAWVMTDSFIEGIDRPDTALLTLRQRDGSAAPGAPEGSAWFITPSEGRTVSVHLLARESQTTVVHERLRGEQVDLFAATFSTDRLPDLPAPPAPLIGFEISGRRSAFGLSWPAEGEISRVLVDQPRESGERFGTSAMTQWLEPSIDPGGIATVGVFLPSPSPTLVRVVNSTGISGFSQPAEFMTIGRRRPAAIP